jgi:hypothetical protein
MMPVTESAERRERRKTRRGGPGEERAAPPARLSAGQAQEVC